MVKLDFDLERDVPQLTDKIILITGGKRFSYPSVTTLKYLCFSFSGTNGLGAAAAKMLASRNPAKIFITGRNESAAQQVVADIQSTGSKTQVVFVQCDHADLASVKKAAYEIAKECRLDVLMANAGVMALPPGKHRVF
jgi:NAD(P)-dependent dehydrogenase (short-subunit alcohol dehydrogenase family)